MSVISYEMKNRKLRENLEKKLINLKIFLLILAAFLFYVIGGFRNFWLVLMLFCVLIFLYFSVKRSLLRAFELKFKENFDNDFLLSVAENLGLIYQPFGGFFIEDFAEFAGFKGSANILESNRHFSVEILDHKIKIGDVKLLRSYKRENVKFGLAKFVPSLDKILPSGISPDCAFDGLLASLEKSESFGFEMIVKTKGDFAKTELKMLKSKNDFFDIYTDNEILAQKFMAEISINLQKLLENYMCEISLFMRKNRLIIAICDNEVLKDNFKENADIKSKNAKLAENFGLILEILSKA